MGSYRTPDQWVFWCCCKLRSVWNIVIADNQSSRLSQRALQGLDSTAISADPHTLPLSSSESTHSMHKWICPSSNGRYARRVVESVDGVIEYWAWPQCPATVGAHSRAGLISEQRDGLLPLVVTSSFWYGGCPGLQHFR